MGEEITKDQEKRLSEHKGEEEFIEAVAEDCVTNMTDEIKRQFIGDPDPYDFHFGYGMYIRNHYIYGKELPFLILHPDDLSHQIIGKDYRYVERSG